MKKHVLVTDIAEEKGRAKGKAEGRAEGKTEVALLMLEEGLDVQTICRMTGVTKSEIERLKRKQA